MSSLATRVVTGYLRLTALRRWTSTASGEAVLAAEKGSPAVPLRVQVGRRVEQRLVGGFVVERLHPRGGVRAPGAVVYLHGGAYVNQVVRQHWELAADAADTTGRVVDVVLYGLAPQHHALEAVALVAEVLAGLDEEFGGAPVHLAGDSAGAGLALVAALQRREAGLAQPAGLVLVAPWLDLSMSNPEVDAIEPDDPWLRRVGLRPAAAAWAGDLDLRDPRVSPLFADLAGLAPVTVFVGTRDICLPDARLLAARLRAAGGVVVLHEGAGQPHVYPVLPTPEGRAARRDLLAALDG